MADEESETKIFSFIRKIPCSGLLLSVASGAVFSFAGLIVKLIPDVSPIEIMIMRGLIQLIVFLPLTWYKGLSNLGEAGERSFLCLRGIFGGLMILFYYSSVRLIAFSDACTIVFSAPVFVFLIGWMFQGQACGLFEFVTVTLSMTGVTMISKPEFLFHEGDDLSHPHQTLGIVFAILGSVSTAIAAIVMRKLKKTHSLVVVNAHSFGCIIIGTVSIGMMKLLLLILDDEVLEVLDKGVRWPVDMREIGWLIANGVCGAVGQLLFGLSLKLEEASLVSLGRTMDIVMSFLYQISFLNEAVTWTSVTGAVIVCGSVGISAIRKWLSDKPGKWKNVWFLINCCIPNDRSEEVALFASSNRAK